MIKTDEDALICDLAETYKIYNYKQLPPSQVAIFANGLRENSRIKLIMTDQKVATDTILLSAMTDSLRLLVWSKTKDGTNGRNMPKSILSSLYTVDSEQISAYTSGKEFEEARDKLLKGG